MAENFQPQFMLTLSVGIIQGEENGGERLTAQLIESVRFLSPSGGGFTGDWTAATVSESHRFMYAKEYEAFKKIKPQLMRNAIHLKAVANPVIWNYLQKQGANTLEEANGLLEPNTFRKHEAEFLEKATRLEIDAAFQNLRCVKKITEDLLMQIEKEEKPTKKDEKPLKEIRI